MQYVLSHFIPSLGTFPMGFPWESHSHGRSCSFIQPQIINILMPSVSTYVSLKTKQKSSLLYKTPSSQPSTEMYTYNQLSSVSPALYCLFGWSEKNFFLEIKNSVVFKSRQMVQNLLKICFLGVAPIFQPATPPPQM